MLCVTLSRIAIQQGRPYDLKALMYLRHGPSGQVADCPDSFSRLCLRMKSGIPMSSVDHTVAVGPLAAAVPNPDFQTKKRHPGR